MKNTETYLSRQELAEFIGCPVAFIKGGKPAQGILHGIGKDEDLGVVVTYGHRNLQRTVCPSFEVRPIVTPPTEMTEETARAFCEAMGWRFVNLRVEYLSVNDKAFKITAISGVYSFSVRFDQIGHGIKFITELIDFNTPKVLRTLRTLGVDVNGLLPRGLGVKAGTI